jgi:hypothetical protein
MVSPGIKVGRLGANLLLARMANLRFPLVTKLRYDKGGSDDAEVLLACFPSLFAQQQAKWLAAINACLS